MVVHYIRHGMPKTVSTNDIPILYHEPHIEEGYRQDDLHWTYYISSLFQLHNETVNVWSHLLGFVVSVFNLISFQKEYALLEDPYTWPLLAGFAGMAAMFLFSACAHWAANTSPVVHYTGFAVDYAGLSLYGIGSVILHYNYCIHTSAYGCMIQEASVPLGVLLAICICVCGCKSKFGYSRPYPFTRKLWIMVPVGLIYILLELPILHRFYLYFSTNVYDESLVHHACQMTCFLLGAFFFGSHIPERWFPGKFDLIGHSHQIFHFLIVFVSVEQTRALKIDISNQRSNGLQHLTTVTSSPLYTFGAVLFVLFIDICSVYYYYNVIKEREKKTS